MQYRVKNQKNAVDSCSQKNSKEDWIDHSNIDGLHRSDTLISSIRASPFITKAEKAKKTPAISPQPSALISVKTKSKLLEVIKKPPS